MNSLRLKVLVLLSLVSFCGLGPASAQEEPEPLPWEDPSCEFDKTDLKLEPDALLKEFLDRDLRGEFLESSPWMWKAVVCPTRLPGPDSFTVVRGYKFESQNLGKETATFLVHYEVLGTVEPGGEDGTLKVFTPAAETRTETFTAVKSPFGWRLDSFVWPQVLIDRAVTLLPADNWVAGEREELQKAATAKP